MQRTEPVRWHSSASCNRQKPIDAYSGRRAICFLLPVLCSGSDDCRLMNHNERDSWRWRHGWSFARATLRQGSCQHWSPRLFWFILIYPEQQIGWKYNRLALSTLLLCKMKQSFSLMPHRLTGATSTSWNGVQEEAVKSDFDHGKSKHPLLEYARAAQRGACTQAGNPTESSLKMLSPKRRASLLERLLRTLVVRCHVYEGPFPCCSCSTRAWRHNTSSQPPCWWRAPRRDGETCSGSERCRLITGESRHAGASLEPAKKNLLLHSLFKNAALPARVLGKGSRQDASWLVVFWTVFHVFICVFRSRSLWGLSVSDVKTSSPSRIL